MADPTRDGLAPRGRLSIRRMRAVILVTLLIGVMVFTGLIVKLVDDLSARFGPQVRADLEWRARRGAVELAGAADLGIAVEDKAMVMEAFAAHIASPDVIELAAVNHEGTVIAQHGSEPPLATVFAAKPDAILEGPGYLACWRPVQIEGAEIGKVAIVVSTARLSETKATLARVATTTVIAGVIVLLCAALVLFYFTRQVVLRDRQLQEYAATLERRVAERTRELDERNRGMRLVLDNVAQGFITIDLEGVMAAERSAVVDAWLGPPPAPNATFADQVRALAPDFSAWFDVSLQMLRDGILPVDVALGQLPRRFEAGEKSFEVAYSPIVKNGTGLDRVLVILSDITEQLAHQRAEKEQREQLAVFQRIVADRASCEEFLLETSALLAALKEPADRAIELRAVHTLKGNCSMFGFESFAELCHELETELVDRAAAAGAEGAEGAGGAGGADGIIDPGLSAEQRARLLEGGARVVATMGSLLGGQARGVVEIDRAELQTAIELVRRVGDDELSALLSTWAYEPVGRRFERFAQQARALAQRLGKGELQVTIADGGVRLDPAHWAPLWTAMVHAIRNAVDHGIEEPAERARLGKGTPHLTFTALRSGRELVLSIADDGRGIDWGRLRQRAEERGARHDSRDDLVALLFAGGVSTRDEATQTSGRGVGVAALREAVVALGGRLELESEPGAGTRLEMQFPFERRTAHAATRPPGGPRLGAM